MEFTAARRLSSPAHACSTRLSCNALHRCVALIVVVGQGNFDRALRFDLNAPCVLAHTSLTALARSVQWTGFYACCLDALGRSGVVTIMTSMLAAISISRCA
jgi:hypothetical protein